MKRQFIYGSVAVTVCIMVAALALMAQRRADTTKAAPLPSFSVRNDATGARILYSLKRGKSDHAQSIQTKKAGWSTGHPPVALQVYCFRYHNTGGAFCGVACTDNSWYPMDCGADIFGDGFDIEE